MILRQTILSFLCLFALFESSAAVVFGQRATINDFAFTVSLQWKGRHKCGGTLISPDTVLSVAHCYSLVWVKPRRGRFVSVLLGTVYQRPEPQDPIEPLKTRAYVRKVIFAPGVPKWFKILKNMLKTPLRDIPNDYMILKLDRNITKLKATPIRDCRGKNRPQPGDECVVGGWGRYRFPDTNKTYANFFPRQLRKGMLHISRDIKKTFCKRLPPTMMCTNQIIDCNHKSKGTPCFGDSGNPLMCRDTCNALYLGGLVEAGATPCGSIKQKAIFMRISSMLQWIELNM